MYGLLQPLAEAPLAWMLFLHEVLREIGGQQSCFDECYWFWPSKAKSDGSIPWPSAGLTTHVDDLAAHARQSWLDKTYAILLEKFGRLMRQQLPFDHCGF